MRSIFILLFVLLQLNIVVAQQNLVVPNGTQISDNTTPDALNPLPFSILDLSSSERGFLMPRLTTDQRNNIPAAKLVAGLTIYNTTMGCVEFYNVTRQSWMNLCGDVEPAVFTIPNDKCQQIKISGDYQQGILLNDRRHLITLEVNVSTPGTFDIEAIAYDNTGKVKNGYAFTTKGVFPTSGNFLLVLKGTGTPVKGYTDKNTKDVIKFWLNKKESTCTISNYVKPDYEQMALAFVCNDPKFPISLEGKYKIDEPLTSANRIIVPFTVTKPGRGRVYGEIPKSSAQTEVIKYQSETIDFRETLPGEVQWVALSPTADTGKPTTSGNLTGKLVFKSTGKNEYDPTVDPVLQTINGCDFTINVERSLAVYKFVSATPVFESDFTAQTIGPGYGTPYITPRTNMDEYGEGHRFRLKVTIDIERAGDYEIRTNTENGINFYAKDVFPSGTKGKKEITLVATGISKTDLPPNSAYFTAYDIYAGSVGNSPNKSSQSNDIDFVYRPMFLYGIGELAWYPGGSYTGTSNRWNAMFFIMTKYIPRKFSYYGDVRVDGLHLVNTLGTTGNSGDVSGVALKLRDGLAKADMVFFGSSSLSASFAKSSNALDYLGAFANKGGVVIFGESVPYKQQIEDFASKLRVYELGNVFSSVSMETKSNTITNMGAPLSDPDINSSDLIISNNRLESIEGNKISSNYNSTTGAFSKFTGFSSLAKFNDNSNFALIHNRLGVVLVSSSTFMGGRIDNRSTDEPNLYPSRADINGNLLTAPFTGGAMYNSSFFVNLIHWSIDYAQGHRPNKIKKP